MHRVKTSANRFVPLFSTQSGAVPTASVLYQGELVINIVEGETIATIEGYYTYEEMLDILTPQQLCILVDYFRRLLWHKQDCLDN
jgi:hypothetical protein